VICPSRAATLPLAEFVGDADTLSGVRLKVGVIEKPVKPSTFKQSGNVADCETSKLSESAILAPVTVIGDGRLTVTVDAGPNRLKFALLRVSCPSTGPRAMQVNPPEPRVTVALV
jgi:hypothetical protein